MSIIHPQPTTRRTLSMEMVMRGKKRRDDLWGVVIYIYISTNRLTDEQLTGKIKN